MFCDVQEACEESLDTNDEETTDEAKLAAKGRRKALMEQVNFKK